MAAQVILNEERFVWRRGDFTISQCFDCQHWTGRGRCEAFPNGVPDEILTNEHDHRKAYPGDNGIRFKRLEKSE